MRIPILSIKTAIHRKKYDIAHLFYKKCIDLPPLSKREMKEKYEFDSEHLVYVKVERTFARVGKRCLKFLLCASAIGTSVWLLSYLNFIPSPKVLLLQNKGNEYISEIHQLDSKFTQIESFLADVQSQDDSCYRVLSRLEPLSADKRKASFGGTNKYANLEGYYNSDLFVTYNRKVDILSNKLNLQEQSYESVLRSVKHTEDSLLSVPAILPMVPNSYRVSSSYGWRIHPINLRKLHHDGLDMASSEGQKVYCTGNGVVTAVSNDPRGYGKQVIVDHGYGYRTRYAHLSKFSVSVGDTVCRGSVIGRVGNTGKSTGPHLHYEVMTPTGRQNPENFFIKDLTSSEYKEMLESYSNLN